MNGSQIVCAWKQVAEEPDAWNKVFQMDKDGAENQGANHKDRNGGEIKFPVAAENI